MQTPIDETALGVPGVGAAIVQEMAAILLPTKIRQRVKQHLRREARKPIDMGTRTHLMHTTCIDSQEIA